MPKLKERSEPTKSMAPVTPPRVLLMSALTAFLSAGSITASAPSSRASCLFAGSISATIISQLSKALALDRSDNSRPQARGH